MQNHHGPYVYNFEEIYEILENQKITKKIIHTELSKVNRGFKKN